MTRPAPYLIMPNAAAEAWEYIPVDFAQPENVAGDPLMIVREARLYHFGILSSAMHMAWIRFVYGKNAGGENIRRPELHHFPWPINHTQMQLEAIEARAQELLDIRAQYYTLSFEQLYDPLRMPESLREAHAALDAAVDVAYRRLPFHYTHERIAFLTHFDRQLSELLVVERGKRVASQPQMMSDYAAFA